MSLQATSHLPPGQECSSWGSAQPEVPEHCRTPHSMGISPSWGTPRSLEGWAAPGSSASPCCQPCPGFCWQHQPLQGCHCTGGPAAASLRGAASLELQQLLARALRQLLLSRDYSALLGRDPTAKGSPGTGGRSLHWHSSQGCSGTSVPPAEQLGVSPQSHQSWLLAGGNVSFMAEMLLPGNPRMGWVGRDLKAHPVPPLPWQRHFSLLQAAPTWPWALPGIQGQPQLLWEPVPGLPTSSGKSFFPESHLNLSSFLSWKSFFPVSHLNLSSFSGKSFFPVSHLHLLSFLTQKFLPRISSKPFLFPSQRA
ncbi:uncharacterized protein LOC120499149 [Passer montanus]|uniref:uncharacterized protein LOC120499149 n=1 Tax=Passer montanus TaxID=9160 RepID=UPI0019604DFE|nr:uncharacterized protein LOC120499149 [Passer montanus]